MSILHTPNKTRHQEHAGGVHHAPPQSGTRPSFSIHRQHFLRYLKRHEFFVVQTTRDQHIDTERIQHSRVAARIVDNLLQRRFCEQSIF
jgi:hypothetical protein